MNKKPGVRFSVVRTAVLLSIGFWAVLGALLLWVR